MVSRKEFGVTSTSTHFNHNFPPLFLLFPSKTFLGRNHDRDQRADVFGKVGKREGKGRKKLIVWGMVGGPSLLLSC